MSFLVTIKAQEDQLIIYDANSFSHQTKPIKSFEINLEDIKSNNFNGVWQIPSYHQSYQNSASQFSEMSPIANLYNSEQYPASASVKIVAIHGDTTWDKCSGMLVGDKYVLTAAHCVINEVDNWKEINEFVPYLYVKPAFDNGKESKFGRVKVDKVYIYKSYFTGKSKKDLALLELSTPIGNTTGWVNMGFEDDNEKLIKTHFYNFSYPMDGAKVNYYRDFNGDTLYVKDGKPDLVSQQYIGINKIGIPGESGSLLIADEKNGFTAYGVRNFSETKYSFYRLKKEDVLTLYNLMNGYENLKSTQPTFVSTAIIKGITVYPNPVFEKAIITASPNIDMLQVSLYDLNSAEVFKANLTGNNGQFILENHNLPRGNYFLIAKQNNLYAGSIKLSISK